MKATARANINMALTKYWGKRDSKLMLPQNGSVSVTLGDYGTTTTVEFSDQYSQDLFFLDEKKLSQGEEYDRVVGQLQDIRKAAQLDLKAKVVSINKVVTAAGLASSTSGAAALAAAAAKAAGLKLSMDKLATFARLGSGSATRSVHGGFVEWARGKEKDGSDSTVRQLADEKYWPEFRVVAVIVNKKPKAVKSRAGMAQTIQTCPFYPNWLDHAQEDIENIKKAIKTKDFRRLGEITEHSTFKMHALMMTTIPAIIYWEPTTMELIQAVRLWRQEDKLQTYFTIDAGPQVKILCLKKDISYVTAKLKTIPGIQQTIICKVGKGVEYSQKHLF
jgi:diphosphomevalonate decarboxylase